METALDYKHLYEQQLIQIEMLKAELAQLKRLIFGSKSERFLEQVPPEQLAMDMEVEAIAATKISSAQKISYTRVQSETKPIVKPVRMKLPEHLERRDRVIEPEASTEGCRRISEEITEELEYEPGKLFVNRFIRPKYVAPDNMTFLIAPMPERPINKAIAGPGLLTQIVIDKYLDHLPLYRQQQRFSRENINIPYSTLTDWVSNTCKLIEPLYNALCKEAMNASYLHVDETPIPVLDKDKKGATHRGYYWVYHDALNDLVIFDYRPGRGQEAPSEMLKDFKGHVQTDGYSGYNFLNDQKDITLFHCWAHARRKFFDALNNDKARATHALEQIRLLYGIERRATEEGLSSGDILSKRQKEAVPILDNLHEWMIRAYTEVTPKSPIGKAIAYSLHLWKGLTTYTTDGKLNIDNNRVENSIRPVAVGRKNYLFAGSHEAAQRSAMLYSLFGTCKRHDVNPSNWMREVLEKLATHPQKRISELLPHNWKGNQ